MSGRRRRQHREAAARVATLVACDCGHYPHDFMTPCALLASIVALERRGDGYCAQCGYRFQRYTDGPWRHWWCERGHSSGMECLWP